MRIHSLQTLPPVTDPAVVIVNSNCFGVDLTSFESRSVFLRSVPESHPEDLPLVVVNPTPAMVQELHKKGVFESQSYIEMRANSTGFSDLVLCLSEFDDLAVSGTFSSQEWFRVRVQRSTSSDRSGQDLTVGLKASSLTSAAEAWSPVAETHNTGVASSTLISDVVQIATRISKPIQPYLPAPVVHILYKILGVIR